MQDITVLFLPLLLVASLMLLFFWGVRRRQQALESSIEGLRSPELKASAPELPLHVGRFRLPLGFRMAAWCAISALALVGLLFGRAEALWTCATLLGPWVVEQIWEYRNPTLTLTESMAIHRHSMLQSRVEIPLHSVQSWGFSRTILVLLLASGKPISIPVHGFSQTEVEGLVHVLSALLPTRRDDAIAEVSLPAPRVTLPGVVLFLVVTVGVILVLFWLFA